MIEPRLIRAIRRAYAMRWDGIHGAAHWTRVRENGLRLAPLTGARPHVVELFAFLHDSQRRNDLHDPEHGPRAARLAARLRGSAFDLEADDFDLLFIACRDHSDGLTEGDVTVRTCWDADRLDLGRVGIRPSAPHLCTEAARDPAFIEWAYARSIRDEPPETTPPAPPSSWLGRIAAIGSSPRRRRTE